MLSKLRSYHPSHATVVAYLALFITLGGTSYGVATGFIDSREIKNNAVKSADLKNNDTRSQDVRNNSLTGADVKNLKSGDVANGSLLAQDFAAGQLPKGDKGDKGEQGVPATKLFGNFLGSDGSLTTGSGVVSSERSGEGWYTIRFNQNLANCVLLASTGSMQNASNPEPRIAGASQAGSGVPDTAFVLIFDAFTDDRDDANFSLAAFC